MRKICYKVFPSEVYQVAVSILCIGLVVLVAWKGWRAGIRYSALLAFIEYVGLLFCSTVFCRMTLAEREYNYHPFWSYKVIQEGKVDLLPENIMNAVVFIPVGILLPIISRSMSWWKALLIGCSISITIETLQYFLLKGFSEVDDMMHNTVGGLFGSGMIYGLKAI